MKQSIEDTNEWSCMNCGLLILDWSAEKMAEDEVQQLSQEFRLNNNGHNPAETRSLRTEPHLPGEESIAAKTRRLQIEALEAPPDSKDSEGDDAEWKRLNP